MSSDGDLSPAPEPTTDPAPDRAPGGPADAFEPDADGGAPATPDQPRSAQVEEHEVPDEIDAPEHVEGGDQSDGAEGSDDREAAAEDVDDADAEGEPAG